jgi:putative ABC transport system permease protein
VRWLRRLWHKSVAEKQLDSELQFHLEQQISDYISAGMSPVEARRRASMEFGGLERFKEECREARWENRLDILVRDFRFALRGLKKDRRFAFIAIFALALGIGASTAIFSVVDNALFAPFPYKDSRQLVTMKLNDLDDSHHARGLFTFNEFEEFKKQNHVFDNMVANLQDDMVYATGDSNLLLGGNYVTQGTFEFYSVAPYLGRSLEPADYQAGAPPVFVMRYATWVKRFNADPSWIGKSFNFNGFSRTLVGIAAPRFAWGGADLWMPRGPEEPKILRGHGEDGYWGVISRIKPGVSRKEAAADLTVIAQRLSAIYPKVYPKRFAIEVESFAYAVVPPQFRNALYIFSAAVGLLLLIGCGNVANLLLARATTREKEFAVRTALGASRSRLVRQLLAESFLLAIAGAIVGIFFAWAGVKTIAAVIPNFTIASETVIEMNGAVLLFAVAVGVCTVFIFGLFPALQASRCDLSESLRDTGKGVGGRGSRSGLRNAVVVLEVALSLTLLFTAGLFVRSFVALQQVSLGLQIDHVVTARLPLPTQRYKTADQLQSFFRPLLARLKSVPGVAYAAESSTLPPYGGIRSVVEVSGKSHTEKWYGLVQLCSEDYFSVLRIPVLDGRTFTEAEVNDRRKVVVINQTFQRRYFGNEDPIGHRIQLNVLKEFPDPVDDPAGFEVIGVVGDARNRGLVEPLDPETWVPYTVTGSAMRGILIRTTNEPRPMIKTVAREIWATDPSVAMAEPETLEYFLDLFTFAQPRFGLWIVAIFASIGLLLVTIGVYSVTAYATSQRTHEIGIRMALGAAGGDVLKMVLRTGLLLLLGGIAIGLAVSFTLSRVIVSQLWGVSPHDPLTLASVAGLLLAVGLVACWIPARRATRINPVNALRYE